MNSIDIYLIKDINQIISEYQIQINKIYNLQKDLSLFKLCFMKTIYYQTFKNIYVNIDIDEFIIIIENNRIYKKEDFYKYFHNLNYTKKIKLFYIFIDEILKIYKILDFENSTNLFDIFNIFIFDYLFFDYNNKTIKKDIGFDYIYSYKVRNGTNIININRILKRLIYNTRVIINSKKIPYIL